MIAASESDRLDCGMRVNERLKIFYSRRRNEKIKLRVFVVNLPLLMGSYLTYQGYSYFDRFFFRCLLREFQTERDNRPQINR